MAIPWLLAALCLAACYGQNRAGGDGRPASDDPPINPGGSAAAGVEEVPTAVAVAVEPGGRPRVLTIDTSLVVDLDVLLMPRMSGIVEAIFAERGSRVTKGDVLLRLMNRDLELQLRRAGIIAARRRADSERARQLFAERAIPPSQYDEAQFALEGAEVDVEIAREDLERSLVRAPFDGVIADRFARIGQKVVEDESQPLFRLTAMSPLQARLYLPEEVARELRPGDRVEVRPRFIPDTVDTGTIEWISGVIDASSGTSQAIVSLSRGRRFLTPGTAVTITLSLPAAGRGVLIPPAALEGGTGSAAPGSGRVEVLDDGHRVWRKVRIGGVDGDTVLVLEGLRPGERVVLTRAGQAVAVGNR